MTPTTRVVAAGSADPEPSGHVFAFEAQKVEAGAAVPSLLVDYREFFKVRVTALVVLTAWAGFYLGCFYIRLPDRRRTHRRW